MSANIIHMFSYTFMAIFPIANPIGMSTIFLSLTRYHSAQERRKMAKRIAIYSFFVYWITLLAGSWIMSFFHISIPIIKVSGGLVVFFTAWNMLNSKPKLAPKEQHESMNQEGDITFFPLTMPITTGAGSLAMAMAIGASIIGGGIKFSIFTQLLGATFGLVGISLTVFFCYYFADRIFARLGKVGTDVVTQVSAFILLAVSVAVIWDGVRGLILTLPH
jgi:multiple antibiotic resistance protein